MNKSECHEGQIVRFTCNGRGRGGHYGVTAVVTKVNSKNALLTECKGSYRPGTRWRWPIEMLRADERDSAMAADLRNQFPDLFKELK